MKIHTNKSITFTKDELVEIVRNHIREQAALGKIDVAETEIKKMKIDFLILRENLPKESITEVYSVFNDDYMD